MPLIEILTDLKREEELKNVIKREIVNNNEVMYIKEKNIENIKNIKLETLVLNDKIENKEVIRKIISNSKYLIINIDNNPDLKEYVEKNKKIITYGYNSNSDITISSIEEEKSFLSLQRNITSIAGKKIEMQEIKADVNCQIDIYNIMIIIALTLLYAK